MAKAKPRTLKHYFYFNTTNPLTGKKEVKRVGCKVRQPKTRVTLTLTEEDVVKSMRVDGVGNTQTCTMALCCQRLAKHFPHDVVGFIDWQYHTCYVVSKLDKDGWPSECYRYVHQNIIAKLNDTPGGQAKLKQMIKDEGGKIDIVIRPRAPRKPWKGGGHGQTTGERSRSLPAGRGAKLRFATANLGLTAPTFGDDD